MLSRPACAVQVPRLISTSSVINTFPSDRNRKLSLRLAPSEPLHQVLAKSGAAGDSFLLTVVFVFDCGCLIEGFNSATAAMNFSGCSCASFNQYQAAAVGGSMSRPTFRPAHISPRIAGGVDLLPRGRPVRRPSRCLTLIFSSIRVFLRAHAGEPAVSSANPFFRVLVLFECVLRHLCTAFPGLYQPIVPLRMDRKIRFFRNEPREPRADNHSTLILYPLH